MSRAGSHRIVNRCSTRCCRWLLRLALLALLPLAGIWYVTAMPGSSWSGPRPPLTVTEREIRAHLETHVGALAGEIGERNVWRPGSMSAAARYIEDSLVALDLSVEAQSFSSRGEKLRNLAVELPGRDRPGEVVVVGAHYDTVAGSPGANDNASGVAALLELARLLRDQPVTRSVRLVAFANEEAPFFYTDEMGSHRYAERARTRGEHIVAMFSLETMGYFASELGTQRYPFPFRYFYPDTGDFIGFVGNLASRPLVRRVVALFRASVPFPAEGVAAPANMEGIHWSDHWSFWEAGYPAIMVTDTAPFRYPFYHTVNDTPRQLDYAGLARVTGGLAGVVTALANE